jgi:hypothetical protein
MAKTEAKSAAVDSLRARKRGSIAASAGDEGYLDELARYLDQLLDESRDAQSDVSLPSQQRGQVE